MHLSDFCSLDTADLHTTHWSPSGLGRPLLKREELQTQQHRKQMPGPEEACRVRTGEQLCGVHVPPPCLWPPLSVHPSCRESAGPEGKSGRSTRRTRPAPSAQFCLPQQQTHSPKGQPEVACASSLVQGFRSSQPASRWPPSTWLPHLWAGIQTCTRQPVSF